MAVYVLRQSQVHPSCKLLSRYEVTPAIDRWGPCPPLGRSFGYVGSDTM